jgi:hypothetical protein
MISVRCSDCTNCGLTIKSTWPPLMRLTGSLFYVSILSILSFTTPTTTSPITSFLSCRFQHPLFFSYHSPFRKIPQLTRGRIVFCLSTHSPTPYHLFRHSSSPLPWSNRQSHPARSGIRQLIVSAFCYVTPQTFRPFVRGNF